MLQLTKPSKIRLVRHTYGNGGVGEWHIMKTDKVAHCNLFFANFSITEESTLENVNNGELCKICWPWEYRIVEI